MTNSKKQNVMWATHNKATSLPLSGSYKKSSSLLSLPMQRNTSKTTDAVSLILTTMFIHLYGIHIIHLNFGYFLRVAAMTLTMSI
jgi:hypothetical protein